MTTPTISTLLLLPAAGDSMGLLACDPVLGTRPPMMALCYRGTIYHDEVVLGDGGVLTDATEDVHAWQAVPWAHDLRRYPGCPRALVLAHNSEPVPEGCDRLYRKTGIRWAEDYAIEVLNRGPESAAIWMQRLRNGITECNLGTLLALDPAGRDVTDEVLRG